MGSRASKKTSEAGRQVRLTGVLRRLERATIAAERPIRRLVGSNRFNPLPHAGTISVFLLLVIIVTGLYLTMFFEFGYRASYDSVVALEGHPIQRVMRGIHRFASAALVVTTIVHGWRIFVAARFTGARRWRWATGVWALAFVFLAGVTGYWLIWDSRAQAINEVFASVMGVLSTRWEAVISAPASTGWVPLVVLWFVHLLLTGVIGWALWRHVRKSRHPWLPPHRWSALMGAALLVASIAFPAGMLPPADPARAPGSMPLDPFVMFLLPPLLSPWPWLALLGAGAVAVVAGAFPWFLRRSDPPVVEIVDGSCTGCELCVLDCPYLALTMSGEGDGAVAVVDPAKCVGCGICLGSCSFDAITGLGSPLAAVPDVAGRAVVVGCERHLRQSGENIPASAHLVEVRCTGELNPRAISTLVEQGAVSVQVVGCPPGDCAYGVGNVLTSERLERRRRPFLPRAWEGRVVQDWISPGELLDAISMPGAHPSADKATVPPGGLRVVPVTVVVVLSVLAIRWATDTQYSRIESEPVVRVVVDHASGAVLAAGDGPTGGDAVLTVSVDGVAVLDQHIDGSGGSVAGVFDVPVPLGPAAVEVSLAQGDATAVLYDGAIESESWSRLLVTAFDESPDPLAEQGRQVFTDAQQGGCDVCHSVEVGRALVGPSLAGIAARAADAVPGLDAETYLRQSILQPDAFVVDGYRAGQMLPIYRDRLSDDQLEAVVAYLLTLTEGGS